jgi:hypothetical protein
MCCYLALTSCRLKITALGNMLSLPPREVTALARKCPNLLVCNSDSLADKFASLKSLMAVGGIGPKQVCCQELSA